MSPLASTVAAVAVLPTSSDDTLATCLDSLAVEVEAGRARVWVLGTPSGDGSPSSVGERHGWAQVLPAGASLESASGTGWVAYMHADTMLEPGALVALLEAGARDPGAGAVVPRILAPDGSPRRSTHAFPTPGFALQLNLGRQRLDRQWGWEQCLEGQWAGDQERRVHWADPDFVLLRREAWEAVGAIETSRRDPSAGLDLGWRLRRAGWGVRYTPAATVRCGADKATEAERDEAVYRWLDERRGRARARAVAAVNLTGARVREGAYRWLARGSQERFGAKALAWESAADRHGRAWRSLGARA